MNAQAIAIQFADALCRARPLTSEETDMLCAVIGSTSGIKRTIWTQADDQQLRRLVRKRLTAERIAEQVGRTAWSVRSRIKRLKRMEAGRG